MQPSGLRNTQVPPESPRNSYNASHVEHVRADGIHPEEEVAEAQPEIVNVEARLEEPVEPPTLRSRLLGQIHKDYGTHECGEEDCTHGTTSPRPRHIRAYDSYASAAYSIPQSVDGYGGPLPGNASGRDGQHALLGDAITDGLLGHANGKKKGTTSWLAHAHKIPRPRLMYVELVA